MCSEISLNLTTLGTKHSVHLRQDFEYLYRNKLLRIGTTGHVYLRGDSGFKEVIS